MKKMSVTIKATIIGVVLTGIVSLLLFALPIVIDTIKDYKKYDLIGTHGFIEQKLIEDNSSFNKDIIKELTAIKEKSIRTINIYKFDLVGDKKNDDLLFYIGLQFNKDDENMETGRYGIISISDNNKQLVFYDNNLIGGETKIIPFYYDDKSYFITCYHGGSGYYMGFNIYSYDGITIPKNIMTSSSYGMGELFFDGDCVLIKGNNHRYSLQKTKVGFKLKKYSERYIEKKSNFHVLKIDTLRNKLKISFDDKVLEFPNDEGLDNETIIELKSDDVVIIDDNSTDDKRYIRYLMDQYEGVVFHDGFFDQITFEKKGQNILMISDTYTQWYSINFIIK